MLVSDKLSPSREGDRLGYQLLLLLLLDWVRARPDRHRTRLTGHNHKTNGYDPSAEQPPAGLGSRPTSSPYDRLTNHTAGSLLLYSSQKSSATDSGVMVACASSLVLVLTCMAGRSES